MIDIAPLLSGHPARTAREALYYTARFVKQAESIARGEKDIFEDDVRSAPSPEGRTLTKSLIAAIEAAAGKPASSFSRTLMVEVLNDVTSASEGLKPEFTFAEQQGAQRAIEAMLEAQSRYFNE